MPVPPPPPEFPGLALAAACDLVGISWRGFSHASWSNDAPCDGESAVVGSVTLLESAQPARPKPAAASARTDKRDIGETSRGIRRPRGGGSYARNADARSD